MLVERGFLQYENVLLPDGAQIEVYQVLLCEGARTNRNLPRLWYEIPQIEKCITKVHRAVLYQGEK